MKKIPYGITNYEELINNGCYYVDKTMYLQTLEDKGNALLYLRPRRFGKTLFTSMMYYYYDINSANKFDTLFKDTYVYNNPTSNKNNYYILKFDFSGISTSKLELDAIMDSFKVCVCNGIESFLSYYNIEYEVEENLNPADTLKKFLNYINTIKLDHKIYVIVDEYDNVTNSLLKEDAEVFKDILGENGFIRDFYSVLKQYRDSCVGRIFITGVCSISVDAMTSGFNIAKNLTNDFKLNSMIGLTHDEVKALISEIDEEDKQIIYNTMIEYYDGYKFNKDIEVGVFNATLVMYLLDYYFEYNKVPEKLFDSNIISDYEKIRNVIKIQNNPYYKEILDKLFETRTIEGTLKDNFSLDTEVTYDDIISLLYYFGYITIDKEISSVTLLFKIPNKVIDRIFNEYYLAIQKEKGLIPVKDGLEEAVADIRDNGSIKKFSIYISNMIKNSNKKILEHYREKDIQILYNALLSRYMEFNVEYEYQVSNGYIDLMIKKNPKYSKYDVMIELKYIKMKECNNRLLEQKRVEAIEQLERYSEDKRIDKTNLKRYVIIYAGYEVKVLEEV